MPRARLLAWMAVLAVGAATGRAGAAQLRGEVVRVGFAGSGQMVADRGADRFRIGCYTPVRVELSNLGGDTFRGTIEARQRDRDGDEVIARRPVMVSGGATQWFYLYVPAGEAQGREHFSVRVLDQEGGLVSLVDEGGATVRELAPASDPAPIPPESFVILDITEVNRLRELVTSRTLNRPVVVLRTAASELPDNPAGLEMADVIVWDGGDPGIMDLPHREALLEWTRRGGRLVIGVGRNWEQLSRSSFAEALPARLSRPAVMTEVDPGWEKGLTDGGILTAFDPPLTYCPITLSALTADSLPVIPVEVAEGQPILAARRPCGRGDIILVAAELRELTDSRRTTLDPLYLLRPLVGLRREVIDEDEQYGLSEDLFRYIEQQTGFQVTTQFYLLFAFVFVVGYVGLATGGSWWWLRKRKLIQHAWGAFALIAVAAAGLSLAAVHLIRGVGFRVQELAFVDAEAGSREASATTYFGLKTPTHTTLDVCVATRGQPAEKMPEGSTSLRPMPINTGPLSMGTGQFQAGQRYEAVAALGELREVPLRATLKQFEATWRGPMDGTLEASLRRERAAAINLHPESWIHNKLGTDLTDCYLLVPTANSGWPDHGRLGVRTYYIGKLADGKRMTIAETDEARAAARGETLKVQYLTDLQQSWLSRDFRVRMDPNWGMVRNAEEEKIDLGKLTKALTLFSTFGDIVRDQRRQIVRSHGQHLDRSLALTRETALLIGFSADPGPAELCWRRPGDAHGRWRPLESEPGRKVVYRVTIPID